MPRGLQGGIGHWIRVSTSISPAATLLGHLVGAGGKTRRPAMDKSIVLRTLCPLFIPIIATLETKVANKIWRIIGDCTSEIVIA
jgi:hypothetical protein